MTINLAGRLAALSTEALAFVPPTRLTPQRANGWVEILHPSHPRNGWSQNRWLWNWL
jgi:hypothetical protein